MKGDQGSADVMAEFRRRWIRQLVATVALALGLLLWAGVSKAEGDGRPVTSTIVIVGVAAVGIFSVVNWRCPSCRHYLGRTIYPRHCSGCGVRLR